MSRWADRLRELRSQKTPEAKTAESPEASACAETSGTSGAFDIGPRGENRSPPKPSHQSQTATPTGAADALVMGATPATAEQRPVPKVPKGPRARPSGLSGAFDIEGCGETHEGAEAPAPLARDDDGRDLPAHRQRAAALIERCAAAGVTLRVEGRELRVGRAIAEHPDLADALRAHRYEVLVELRAREGRCFVCGEPAPAASTMPSGEPVHVDCLDRPVSAWRGFGHG